MVRVMTEIPKMGPIKETDLSVRGMEIRVPKKNSDSRVIYNIKDVRKGLVSEMSSKHILG